MAMHWLEYVLLWFLFEGVRVGCRRGLLTNAYADDFYAVEHYIYKSLGLYR
jgi:hypothetical protein